MSLPGCCLRGPHTLPMAQEPKSASWSHQSPPQRHCSRATLQLPTALSCPAMGPNKSWPSLIPVPSPRRCRMPGAVLARVPPAPRICPASGWGSGMGPGCQALPCQTPGNLPTPVTHQPANALATYNFQCKVSQ